MKIATLFAREIVATGTKGIATDIAPTTARALHPAHQVAYWASVALNLAIVVAASPRLREVASLWER